MPSKDGRAPALAPSLRDVFERASLNTARVRVDVQEPLYSPGDADDSMYLIESGQVKLSMSSASGKDCLLAVYSAGDIFGESCFAGGKRYESALAMQATTVRRLSRRDFLAEVSRAAAIETLLRHLAERLEEVHAAVFDLVTMDSEKRLAKVLLQLAEKLGTGGDTGVLRLDQKISHEELSQIVGTTRPRVTAFMQKFRARGLIATVGRAILVNRQKTREFLASDVQF